MNAEPEILILDDNHQVLDELGELARANHCFPILARDPKEALRRLRAHATVAAPIMAIIDLDMRLAEQPLFGPTSWDVLHHLGRNYRDCIVYVYSAHLLAADVLLKINSAHPRAVAHPKRDGHDHLFAHVRASLSVTVGDLVLDGGRVVHVPTGEVYHHRAAIKLVNKYPYAERFYNDTDLRALQRFEHDFLRPCESTCAVKSHTRKHRSLHVLAHAEAARVNLLWRQREFISATAQARLERIRVREL